MLAPRYNSSKIETENCFNRQELKTTTYFNAMNSVHFCSITGQNTRGTPTVNHDSGVGPNEKNHGTTAAQHT